MIARISLRRICVSRYDHWIAGLASSSASVMVRPSMSRNGDASCSLSSLSTSTAVVGGSADADVAFQSPLLQHLSSDRIVELQKMGVLDHDGLTVFSTLHELQKHSCLAFASKHLFGTYSSVSDNFEWMTFEEFDDKVQLCRIALQDLGASCVQLIPALSTVVSCVLLLPLSIFVYVI
jgi:hypothetical protein